jgi:hypothetical protein
MIVAGVLQEVPPSTLTGEALLAGSSTLTFKPGDHQSVYGSGSRAGTVRLAATNRKLRRIALGMRELAASLDGILAEGSHARSRFAASPQICAGISTIENIIVVDLGAFADLGSRGPAPALTRQRTNEKKIASLEMHDGREDS